MLKPKYSWRTESIPLLLMPWLLVPLCLRQAWHWLCRIKMSVSYGKINTFSYFLNQFNTTMVNTIDTIRLNQNREYKTKAVCSTDVTPLLTRWSYVSFAWSHRYDYTCCTPHCIPVGSIIAASPFMPCHMTVITGAIVSTCVFCKPTSFSVPLGGVLSICRVTSRHAGAHCGWSDV